jgi:prepilin-type N-terminal cleavage/methylation domain-containing protein
VRLAAELAVRKLDSGVALWWRRDSGYSLPEVMITLCLVAVVAGMAVPISGAFLHQRKADSGVVAAMTAVTATRNRAVAERRNIQITFVDPDRIRISRVEVPGGVLTPIQEFALENGMHFVKYDGVPDTPDAFGADSATDFSGTLPIMFTSDGSLVDANGDVVNGSIFVGLPGQPDSARAVTIFGATGLTRAWKWRGTRWME